MAMKNLSRKQVIAPMSGNNKKNFMEESNAHVSNINRALKTSNLMFWSISSILMQLASQLSLTKLLLL